VGWAGPGFALASAAGLPDGFVATLPWQAVGLIVLAALPRFAWLAAGGFVGLVLGSIPAVAFVTVIGSRVAPAAPPPPELVVVLGLAWLAGLLVAASGRVVPLPWVRPG
jgi:hypothetical protein